MQPLSGEHMSRGSFFHVLDELASQSIFFVNLSGGEPFMHPEFQDLLRAAHDRFRHVMTLTNGTILRDDHVAAIGEILDRKGEFNVQVSLDATDPATNGLTRTRSTLALENIERLSDIGAHVIVATVVTRCNIDAVLDSISHLSRFTRYFHLMTVQDVRRVPDIEKRFAVERQAEDELWGRVNHLATQMDLRVNTPLHYEGYRGCATGAACMAGFSHVVIDPSLEVRPCDRLVDLVIGNLGEDSMQDIWDRTRLHSVLRSPVPYCRMPSIRSHAGDEGVESSTESVPA
jgi:MoaA/NifB/PqqE/SkfB family radical SAM enzyme